MGRKEKRRRKRGQPKSKDAGAPKEGQKSQSPAKAQGPCIGGETTGKTAESKDRQKAQPLARTQGPHVGSNAASKPAGSKDRQRTQTPVKARGPHVSGKAANETAGPKGRVAESGRKQAEEGWIQVKSKAKGVKQAETRVDPNRGPVDGRLAGGRPGNRVEPTLGRKGPAQNHPNSNSSRPAQDSRGKGGLKAPQGNFGQGAPQKRSRGTRWPSRHFSGPAAPSIEAYFRGTGVEGSERISQRIGPQHSPGETGPSSPQSNANPEAISSPASSLSGELPGSNLGLPSPGRLPAAGDFPYPGGATHGRYPYFGFPAHPGMGFY